MRRKKIQMSEAELQHHLVKLLRAYGRPDICWWACPNGEQRSARTGRRLKELGVRPGAADLMLMIDSQFMGLELKTEIGTLSKHQEKFMEDLTRAGGIYISAYGLEQAVAALINMRAFRRDIHIQTHKLLRSEVRAGA